MQPCGARGWLQGPLGVRSSMLPPRSQLHVLHIRRDETTSNASMGVMIPQFRVLNLHEGGFLAFLGGRCSEALPLAVTAAAAAMPLATGLVPFLLLLLFALLVLLLVLLLLLLFFISVVLVPPLLLLLGWVAPRAAAPLHIIAPLLLRVLLVSAALHRTLALLCCFHALLHLRHDL